MNNLISALAVALLVGFFTIQVRSMNKAWNAKAAVEYGPAGDRKAVKMASMMMGGAIRASAKTARVPLRHPTGVKSSPVPASIPVRKPRISEPDPVTSSNGFSKDLKAEWRAKVPKVPNLQGMTVPEVPNILDEPETRSDLPR